MYIEANNIFLRKLRSEDVSQEYVDWLNDEDVNKYLETRHVHQTLQSCLQFVEACNLDVGTHLFGIFLKGSGKHIGNIKIGFINEVYARGEVSLLIGDKDCWGKGYGTESVRAVTRFAKEFLKLKKIEAGCYEDNLGSLRIFLKSGYIVEGFKRGHVLRNNKRLGCFLLGVLIDESE